MNPADALLVFAMPLETRGEAPAVDAPAGVESGCAAPVIDRWRDGDIARVAELLCAAYPPQLASLFTSYGSAAEWRTYVTVLVKLSPCGAFQREWSRVVRDGDAVLGAALLTFVAPATAHLAQLAVRPDVQRRGLATRLVLEAAAAARATGCRELTLLVARENEPARRLYESLGITLRHHVRTGTDG